jgi:hypothetical protein
VSHTYKPALAKKAAREGFGLGRRFAPDGRDYAHLMRTPAKLPTAQQNVADQARVGSGEYVAMRRLLRFDAARLKSDH